MTHPEDPSQTPDATASAPASPRSRRPAALAVGAALVLGGIALAVWAVASTGSSAPQSAVPSSTASAASGGTISEPPGGESPAGEPSAAPTSAASTPPVSSVDAPVISAFTVQPTTALCPDDRSSSVPLTFSWSSEGADRAWIGIATTHASVQPTAEVDPSADGYTGISYACSDADQVFTLTVEGPGGATSSSIAITRELD